MILLINEVDDLELLLLITQTARTHSGFERQAIPQFYDNQLSAKALQTNNLAFTFIQVRIVSLSS